MIQTHNERSNAIGLDWDLSELEIVKVESKERNGRNDKGKLKNQMLQICMIMRKFRMIDCRLRKMCMILHDHAKISQTHAKWSRKCFTIEFCTIMRNVNILWEMSRFHAKC